MYKKINNVMCNQIILEAIGNYQEDVRNHIMAHYKPGMKIENFDQVKQLNQALAETQKLVEIMQQNMDKDHSIVVQAVIDNTPTVRYNSLESYILTKIMYNFVDGE